jgi:hypothetical protein
MMLERYLVNEAHVHHFVVRHDATGWDVREEQDGAIIHRAHLDDWHRVERAVQLFDHAADALKEVGWIERMET